MSDGERDQGSPSKAATQDVYARVASAAASRSGNGPAGNGAGNGSGNGAGGGSGSGAGSTPTAPPARAAGPQDGPTARAGATGSKNPAAANPFPSRAAASTADDAPSASPTAEPTGKGWKDRLGAFTQKVVGSETSTTVPESGAKGSAGVDTAPVQDKGRKAKAGSAKADPAKVDTTKNAPKKPSHAAEGSADESTAVLGTPVAAPAARVTGTRPTAPVAAQSGAKSARAGTETLDPDKPKAGTPRRTRKARLRLSRLDPWSVMKTAFMFSIAGGIMLVVGVYAIWAVVSGSGLFDNVNEIIASVVSTPGDTTPFRVEDYVNTAKVMGVTAFLACIDVVIFTALATLGAFLYNLAATMLGGLEITLAED